MHYIRDFLRGDAAYFANCRKSIMAQNSHMLVDGAFLYALVLAFYTTLSIATGQSALLWNMYFAFDAFHLLLCVVLFTRPVRLKESYRATQIFCSVLEFSVLAFFALEGSLTAPTQHSLYIPIAILLLQLLFIHSAAYSFLTIFLYVASFAVLSRLHKTPEAYTNDVYIAIATFISANIGYMLIAKLRRSEQQALRKFETLSRMDELTGLYNKATLEQLCQNSIKESDRACTLLVVDLDNFKRINDEYGHGVGDEVLKGVGTAMKRSFRANDILGRFGGDEFVILMGACNDPGVVRERMQALEFRVGELRFSVPAVSVHYSAGAAFRREGDDLHTMFVRADQALYAAKGAGKNQLHMEDDKPRQSPPPAQGSARYINCANTAANKTDGR